MKLKRYTNEELKPILTDIFYDYLSDNAEKEYNKKLELIKDCQNKINICTEKYNEITDKDKKIMLREDITLLKEGLQKWMNASMKFQKTLYEQTKACDYSRSKVRIPLDKKINSFYDDLSLEVVFYDDVCTPCGLIHQFKRLTNKQDKIDFVKAHTEVTHLSFVYSRGNQEKVFITVEGKLNTQDPRLKLYGLTLLPEKFSDFETLRLQDTFEIDNNDIKQLLQSKIDLDKENMKELANILIRGDRYGIYSPRQKDDNEKEKPLYIRYTCRSTGRVYFNRINLSNLQISKEFKENDYESYCKAWWNLNTLGGNVEGKPVIRC